MELRVNFLALVILLVQEMASVSTPSAALLPVFVTKTRNKDIGMVLSATSATNATTTPPTAMFLALFGPPLVEEFATAKASASTASAFVIETLQNV